jgi:hypothetical protein
MRGPPRECSWSRRSRSRSRLSATEAPIEAPTPAAPPTAIATDAAAMCAKIDEVSVAVSPTLMATWTVLESMWAVAFVRITFSACAPAPLTLTPARPARPAASDAAAEVAWIVEDSVTPIVSEPLVVLTPVELAM